MKRCVTMAVVLLPLALPASADEAADEAFLRQAMSAGMAQMLYGRLAVQRSEDDRVIALGQDLLKEHSAVNRQLIELAETEGLTPAPVSPGEAERDLEALHQTLPHSFDQAWLMATAAGHRRHLAFYEAYAEDGEDPVLGAHAQAVIPMIREHLQAAETLSSRTEAAAAR